MLRFSFFSDTFIEMDGWYIDNVGVIVDWFESNGSWTGDLVLENSHGFAPTIDVDARVPDGTWVRASLVDSNGTPPGLIASQNLSSPFFQRMKCIGFESVWNHKSSTHSANTGFTFRCGSILNGVDGTNGWSIPLFLLTTMSRGTLRIPL